ncbi:MAG: OmpA family protein [Saprospiraceae bacterium]|nr:OmpA family protein [Candidatus Opimibacter skivensis]
MKSININIDAPAKALCFLKASFRMVSLVIIIWTGILTGSSIQAQAVQYTTPSWWFGVAGGANFNFYRGSTQKLTADFTAPVAFDEGNGVSLYLAPLVEYHAPGTALGFMFQAGYDSRSSAYKTQITPCNCPADLTMRLSYITVEPSIRLAPFHGNFYLFGGPRLAFNVEKSFTYELGINPDFPDQEPTPDIKGDLSDVNKTLVSMQIGAGYDIPLSRQYAKSQFVISPFVSFHPYFGQAPRDIETWNVTTVRVGAAFKFGHGQMIPAPAIVEGLPVEPEFQFSVYSPANKPVDEFVTETFPVRNYVFFDLGSTAIPDRYVTLTKSQVKDFREDQIELFRPKNTSGRSERQMVVYYNVLNILGDRMAKDQAATITLVGSSEKSPEDGRAMAESIRDYLVNVFGITSSRINIEGRDKPKIPSEQPGGTLELDLLRAGDRRVSIESGSPAMLMEFQTGPNAPLKPVQLKAPQQAPMNTYTSFDVKGASKAFKSWSLEVKDEKGKIQKFGPYTNDKVSLSGESILGTRPMGDYRVTMVGLTNEGTTVRREVPVHVVLWSPTGYRNGARYSILYEFNESKAIAMYEKYISDIVTPNIPKGGVVLVRGYTDIIGDEANNHELSHARANDVKGMLESSLAKAGKTNVKIEVKAYGEDEAMSPFENKYPEERFYNRTVIIDILPNK